MTRKQLFLLLLLGSISLQVGFSGVWGDDSEEKESSTGSQTKPSSAPPPDLPKLRISNLKIVLGSTATNTSETLSGKHPETILDGKILEHTETMEVTFKVVKLKSGDPFSPQQAFLMLTSQSTGVTAYFVASARNKSFAAAADSALLRKQIGTESGIYDVTLLVGDPKTAGGVQWNLGKLDVRHAVVDGSVPMDAIVPVYLRRPSTKPEILHVHRPPVTPPPASIPLVFTGLVFVPLAVLLLALAKLKLNLKGFPVGLGSIWAILFHGSIGAILVLYVVFWLSLNMLQTIPPLLCLSLFCTIVGHRALCAVASTKLKKD